MPGTLPAPPGASVVRSPLLVPLALLWLVLWSLICFVEVAVLIHDPRIPHWHPFGITLSSTTVVGAWLAWALLTRRFERVSIERPGRWFRHQLRDLPWLIVGVVVLVFVSREIFFYFIGARHLDLPLRIRLPYESAKVALFYLLWLALMFGLLTVARRREDSERLLGVQKALAEAQLAQLQAQLRPHFLFNALNTVSSLMQTDTGRADRVLAQLGDLLRANLAAGRTGMVTLREEIDLLQKYANIMQERFEGRVAVRWEVSDETLAVPVPSMLSQPLLENAFKHGVERNSEPVCITVRTARLENGLSMEIHNTGSTLMPGWQQQAGVGLRNTRERLRLLYGDAAELVVTNSDGGGVIARVKVPWPAQTT